MPWSINLDDVSVVGIIAIVPLPWTSEGEKRCL